MKYSLPVWPVFCTLLLSVLLFNACDDDNNRDVPDELQKGEGLIPAVIGNRWIYSDSLWMSDTLEQTYFDTVEIADTLMRGDQIWWQTKGYIPDLYDQYPVNGEFYIRNDSIYGVTYDWGNRSTVLRFIPPPDTSISYNVLHSDVYRSRSAIMQPEPITVPAGTFDSCGVYTEIAFGYLDVKTVIAPGIGVILESMISSSVIRKHTLIDYELVLD